jgi:hypothetical protein
MGYAEVLKFIYLFRDQKLRRPGHGIRATECVPERDIKNIIKALMAL